MSWSGYRVSFAVEAAEARCAAQSCDLAAAGVHLACTCTQPGCSMKVLREVLTMWHDCIFF